MAASPPPDELSMQCCLLCVSSYLPIYFPLKDLTHKDPGLLNIVSVLLSFTD